MNPIPFHTYETSKICYESGTDNRLPGTKLGTPGTKGRRRPETTGGLRKPETGHFVD